MGHSLYTWGKAVARQETLSIISFIHQNVKEVFMKRKLPLALIILAAFFSTSCRKSIPAFCNCSIDDLVATSSVYATGLNNPRGLKFGPDGNLYVAEGGTGGANITTSCTQVEPPIGPYLGSPTGARILKIGKNGKIATVADNLPSSQTEASQGPLVSGVGDIAFIGNTLYGVLSGAGCSHGVPTIPNGIVRVGSNTHWSLISDLSNWQMNHPVQNPFLPDFEPDGTWYSMVAVNGNLYAVEPNHGEIVRITPKGEISRLIDISASQGHVVPTAITYHNGYLYVGTLSTFPITGNSSVYKISLTGHLTVIATGFSMITGLAFDNSGGMYVLENTTGNPFPTPGTGDIIRVDPSGARTVLFTGLNLPTYLLFGPDEKLYVSNWGFGPPAIGGGEILKIDVTCERGSGRKKTGGKG
jgi:hypothetical protein